MEYRNPHCRPSASQAQPSVLCYRMYHRLHSANRSHAHRPHHKGMLSFLQDRKSTRLNSSHVAISYAVFCLKKKTNYCANGSYNGNVTRVDMTAPAVFF